MSFRLFIHTYDRGEDPAGVIKPYHWAFFIATGTKGEGVAHQLRGSKGCFYYRGAEEITDVHKSQTKKDGVEIGRVPTGSLGSVQSLLATVPIVKDESSDWNCQSWAKDAFAVMKEQGWVNKDFDMIKDWLKEKRR